MTDRPPVGASIEERLAAIEDRLWPPSSRVRNRDIRIDVYTSGVSCDSVVRIVHIPTGIVVTKEGKSQLQSRARGLEELEEALKFRGWEPDSDLKD